MLSGDILICFDCCSDRLQWVDVCNLAIANRALLERLRTKRRRLLIVAGLYRRRLFLRLLEARAVLAVRACLAPLNRDNPTVHCVRDGLHKAANKRRWQL